jgi:GNAT superfamily N-acetyltransferase
MRRGYAVLQRYSQVELPLAPAASPDPAPPAGVELSTLARRPDLARPLHALALSVLGDMPGEDGAPELSYELFRGHVLSSPAFRPDGAVLALAGERLVGFSYIDVPPARPAVGRHRLTGVARDWRGRGVAGALKRAQIAWAQSAGLELLVAENELRNEPIRRLNARLGYRPRPDWVVLRGPLAA